MFIIAPSKRFLRTVRRYKRAGKKNALEALHEVIHLLSIHDREALIALGARWRDHELKGSKHGLRELHLGFDDLLLYEVNKSTSTIDLIDIVNHEELGKK